MSLTYELEEKTMPLKSSLSILRLTAARCAVAVLIFSSGIAQSPEQSEDSHTKEMRQMWRNIVNQRPRRRTRITRPATQSQQTSAKTQSKKEGAEKTETTPSNDEPKPEYKVASSTIPAQGRDIGITVWRLRPSQNTDAKEVKQAVNQKRLKHDPGGARIDAVYLTAERVEADTALREGEMVQLSVEAPYDGFLYVIDRDRYSDGSFGEPYLIFPTSRTNKGLNRVGAGILTNVPAMTDDPPFLTLDRSGANHVGEEITFILTPKPIPELSAYKDQDVIPEKQFKNLQKWAAQTGCIELVDGAGNPQTAEEAIASRESVADGTKRLKHNSRPPQSIFRVARKPGEPVIVTVLLKIAP